MQMHAVDCGSISRCLFRDLDLGPCLDYGICICKIPPSPHSLPHLSSSRPSPLPSPLSENSSASSSIFGISCVGITFNVDAYGRGWPWC